MDPKGFVSDRERHLLATESPPEPRPLHAGATRRLEPEQVASVRERLPAGLVKPEERVLPGAGAHRQGGRGITLPMPVDD